MARMARTTLIIETHSSMFASWFKALFEELKALIWPLILATWTCKLANASDTFVVCCVTIAAVAFAVLLAETVLDELVKLTL